MRLWHKNLIPVLPKLQLLGQWRECCCIARNIAVDHTPNHLLVNKVMDYPKGHLWYYGFLIMQEMQNRGLQCNFGKFEQWIDKPYALVTPDVHDLFADWHNDRYLMQCFFNLQEKNDCGGMTEEEWMQVVDQVNRLMGEEECVNG